MAKARMKPSTGKFKRALRIGLSREVIHLLRAVGELARARIKLRSINPAEIEQLNLTASNFTSLFNNSEFELARLTLAIRRGSRIVPWRSDCLVQALAAQRWAGRFGIPTAIVIQVGRSGNRDFMAHAILRHNGQCVLGEIAQDLRDIYPKPYE